MSDHNDPLEDLYTDALLNRKQRVARVADPSLRNALDATAKKMREMYTLPENWERVAGVAFIDKASNTLIGNFSEYHHKTIHSTKKWLREHQPILIDRTEIVEGYLGRDLEQRLRGKTWELEFPCTLPILLDELMVETPAAKLILKTRLGVIQRAELIEETQFASMNGAMILRLPAETNIWEACSTDTKSAMRRQVS